MDVSKLNEMLVDELHEALIKCCNSKNWVSMMMRYRPYNNWEYLEGLAELIWFDDCNEMDWLEAFKGHPKIGDLESLEKKFAGTKHLADSEQANVKKASKEVLEALAAGNKAYEEKFGYTFIVSATGKSAEEILHILGKRLEHGPKAELMQAAVEQYKITRLRLEKLLAEG